MSAAETQELDTRLSPPPRQCVLEEARAVPGPIGITHSDALDAAMRRRVERIAEFAGVRSTDRAAEARTLIEPGADPAQLGFERREHPGLWDNPEAYALTICDADGTVRIRMAAPQSAGRVMATRTLAQLWTAGGLPRGTIVDWPECPVRGVIEGFYGPPWSPEARAGMIRFLGAHKFNTFVYAPKDDLYHRSRWRDPYPPDAFAAVREQIDLCAEEALRFVYSLAPGLDIQYSGEADITRILEKYRTVFDAGVRHFGLYFDDIPYVFLNDADVPAYGEATPDNIAPLGVAQAQVAARVFAALRAWDAGCSLIFCPVEYWGECDSDYVRALHDGLPAEVDVFYTGPQICSARLETAHTRAVSARFGRPVTFWDNYPVNDASMTGRLHTNPIVGRDPDLFTAARGLISNPMPQCEASKIALGAIAEYLWGPHRYEASDAFERSLRNLVDPAEVTHMRQFAANMHFCCLHESESDDLREAIEALKAAWGGPDHRACAQALDARFYDLRQSGRVLDRLSNQALRREMAPWVHAFQRWAEIGRAATALYNAPRERQAFERERLERRLKNMEGVHEEVFGTVVSGFGRWVLEQTA